MVLFLTSADASAANGGGSMLVMMIVLIYLMAGGFQSAAGWGAAYTDIRILIAVFYFFMIRPENKRKKEAQAMRDAIKVGDNITTIGGIIGDVVSVKDDSIVIETSADRVRVEFAKFAISTNNTAEKEAAKKRAEAAAARKEKKAKK